MSPVQITRRSVFESLPPVQYDGGLHPSLFAQSLSREPQYYLWMALSQNIKKTYSGVRQFFIFRSHTRITPKLPIDEDALVNFSVSMARSLQPSTMKSYLSVIKQHYFQSWLWAELQSWTKLVETNVVSAWIFYFLVWKHRQDRRNALPPSPHSMLFWRTEDSSGFFLVAKHH